MQRLKKTSEFGSNSCTMDYLLGLLWNWISPQWSSLISTQMLQELPLLSELWNGCGQGVLRPQLTNILQAMETIH